VDSSLEPFLQFALDAAWQAGRITLGYFQTKLTPDKKADNTPVTIADRTAEQKLRELISRYWPDHGIIGEEFEPTLGSANLTWIIDPIDGTKTFVQGVPLYGVLIALMNGQSPLVGVAHFPALNETVYAARGQGCFWNGRRAHVSTVSDIKQAVLLASEGDMTNSIRSAEWQQLLKTTYIQRTWGDSYGYALVATGRAEIMVDAVVKIWDCAPFPVILEEAGGTFTDWKGTPGIDAGESIATNGLLFESVMALVKPSK
jgi:histidinol phosphatase-like enzyme (inositol monophosphatase family)